MNTSMDTLIIRAWESILLVLLFTCGYGCGTEVGNGDDKNGGTTQTTNPTATNSTATNDNVSTSTGSVSNSAATPSSSATTKNSQQQTVMPMLLATCGSPFVDKVSGSFLDTTDSTTTFFTATAASSTVTSVMFLSQFLFSITPAATGQIAVSVGNNTATSLAPPQYQCSTITSSTNLTYLGVTGVTKRSVNLTLTGSSVGSVSWYLRSLGTSGTMQVYRIEIGTTAGTQAYQLAGN